MKIVATSFTLSTEERAEISDVPKLVRDAIQPRPRAGRGVAKGELVLGRFQSVIFAEFDGPRKREITIQVIGE